MLQAAASIARFTLIEGLRTRLPLIVIAALLGVGLAAEFCAGLAITDSQSYRTGVYGACARLLLVFIMVMFVATSVVREFEQRLLDLAWSRPLSRASWYLGRLAGFCVLALACAALAAAPLLVTATVPAALAWGLSLGAELCLLCGVCLTCVVTLRQVTLAVTVVAAFYVLARAIDALVLMSRGPAVDANAWTSALIARALEWLAALLPALDRFTPTTWLSASSLPTELGSIVIQTVIYSVLLAAIGLFDIYRVND